MYFDAKEFGKRLHDVRTSRGITQEELAVRLGLASKQHVSRMENGERSCSIDLLIELSCILHVSTDYLLMGSEPSKEEVLNCGDDTATEVDHEVMILLHNSFDLLFSVSKDNLFLFRNLDI